MFNQNYYSAVEKTSPPPQKKRKIEHYSQNIIQLKYDIKKRWIAMKLGKAKDSKKLNYPRKLKGNNKIKTGDDEIANEFNKYFVDIGPSLAKKYS